MSHAAEVRWREVPSRPPGRGPETPGGRTAASPAPETPGGRTAASPKRGQDREQQGLLPQRADGAPGAPGSRGRKETEVSERSPVDEEDLQAAGPRFLGFRFPLEQDLNSKTVGKLSSQKCAFLFVRLVCLFDRE